MVDPEWLDRPAATRISASSAAVLRPFRHSYNATRKLADQIKPFNFLLCVHVAPFSHPAGYPPERFQLIAPYEPDPGRWLEIDWADIYSGDTFRIHTTGPPLPDSVKVKTIRDVVDRYRTHPEPKSLGPDLKPCNRTTVGPLERRPVTAIAISCVGKESNRLEDRTAGLIHEPSEILLNYGDPALDPWRTLVVPTLRTFSTAEIAARASLDRRSVQRLLNGSSHPRRTHRNILTALAAELARASLVAQGIAPPSPVLATLAIYRDSSLPVTEVCALCGAPLARHRATYCSPTCKKRAARRRRASAGDPPNHTSHQPLTATASRERGYAS